MDRHEMPYGASMGDDSQAPECHEGNPSGNPPTPSPDQLSFANPRSGVLSTFGSRPKHGWVCPLATVHSKSCGLSECPFISARRPDTYNAQSPGHGQYLEAVICLGCMHRSASHLPIDSSPGAYVARL